MVNFISTKKEELRAQQSVLQTSTPGILNPCGQLDIIDLVACFKFVIVYSGGRVTARWNLCLVLSLLISLKPK